MWSSPSLLLLPSPLWLGVAVSVWVPSMSQIDLLKNYSYSIGTCKKNMNINVQLVWIFWYKMTLDRLIWHDIKICLSILQLEHKNLWIIQCVCVYIYIYIYIYTHTHLIPPDDQDMTPGQFLSKIKLFRIQFSFSHTNSHTVEIKVCCLPAVLSLLHVASMLQQEMDFGTPFLNCPRGQSQTHKLHLSHFLFSLATSPCLDP